SSFVGREHELSKLDQLAAQGSRLVTLHGIGGLGKTRLSVEWATACSEDFPGGCYFCDLTEARSLDVICLCLAQALDVPLNEENPVQTLGYALSGRGRLLVIFDNFEQIIAHGSSSIGVWLNMAPEAMFVVTSRQSLGLDGERVVEVEPLQTPGANRHEAIEDNEAVHLFVARAQQTRGDFKLTPDNAQPIAELVRQLDGLPLTIEMAASRIKTLPPAGILSRLSDRFRLLRSSRRDLSGRQVTLLAALDWSWELLDPHEQAALAQCAVFQGSFSLEAAESVLDLSAYEQAPWVADVIESLVDKSLIRVAGDRLLMFVSVHQYAWTKLQQPSMEHELASVRERHAAYFAQYGTPPFLQRLSLSSRAFKELKVELGNLDGALCYAISAGHAHFTGQCALALGKYFYRQGLYEAGLVEVRKALKALSAATEVSKARLLCLFGDLKRVVGRVDDALLHYERALSLACAGGDPRLEGQVLHGLGYTLREQGKLEAALHHFQGALDLARDSRDRCLQGRALYGLGLLLLDQGKLEEAQYHYEGALDLARDSGDRRLEGKALYGLSHLLIDQGGLEEAQHQYRKVIHLARKSGDKRLEGDALCGLGYVLRDQNRSKEALHQYEMALGLALDSGDKRLEAKALYELGYVFKEQAKLEQAQHHFQGALNLARDNGDKHLEGHGLYGLGYVFKEQGHLNAAQHHYQDALNLARDNGDKRLESYSLMGLGHVLREQGDLEQARHYCKETLDLARDSGAKRLESYSLMGLGHVLREQGDLEQALHCCESALGLAHTRSDQRLEATAICGQGHALLEQGRLDEAWPLLREALCLARDNNTQRLEGTILHAFGHALIAQGKLDEAHQHMQEALGIARGNNDTRLESHALLGLVYTAVLGNRHTQALDYLHQAQTLLQHSDSKRLLLLEYDCLQALILACQGQTAQATIVFHSALHQLATLGLKREARLTQLAKLVEKAINDARIHLQLAPNSPKLEEELAPEAQDEATPKPKVDAER
ncbi:MAG: tetratricopeptide repeat protein, partial [Myxococcota bacterium]